MASTTHLVAEIFHFKCKDKNIKINLKWDNLYVSAYVFSWHINNWYFVLIIRNMFTKRCQMHQHKNVFVLMLIDSCCNAILCYHFNRHTRHFLWHNSYYILIINIQLILYKALWNGEDCTIHIVSECSTQLYKDTQHFLDISTLFV